MSDNNVNFIMFNLINLDNNLFNIMYLKELKWEYDYWNHNKKIYSLGACISLVCDVPNNKKALSALKGSSLPVSNRGNTIRGDFGVKDRIINSVHWADSQEQSLEELRWIYKIKLNGRKNEEFINDYLSTNDIHTMVEKGMCLYNCDAKKILINLLERIKFKLVATIQFTSVILKMKIVQKDIYADFMEYFSKLQKIYEFNSDHFLLFKIINKDSNNIIATMKDEYSWTRGRVLPHWTATRFSATASVSISNPSLMDTKSANTWKTVSLIVYDNFYTSVFRMPGSTTVSALLSAQEI